MKASYVTEITSTGAATNVSIGFIPNYVRVINETSNKTFEWFKGLTDDGKAWQTVDSGSGSTDMSELATNGISDYTGSTTASPGVTLGTTVVGSTSDVLKLLAIR